MSRCQAKKSDISLDIEHSGHAFINLQWLQFAPKHKNQTKLLINLVHVLDDP